MDIVLNQDLRPCTLGSGTVTPWAVKPKILESKRNFVTIKKSLPNKYASHRVTITVHFITKYKKTESPVKTTMQDSDVLAIIFVAAIIKWSVSKYFIQFTTMERRFYVYVFKKGLLFHLKKILNPLGMFSFNVLFIFLFLNKKPFHCKFIK